MVKLNSPFHVRIVGLPGLAPLQAPQSACREDEGEDRGHLERDERPDPEEDSAGVGDPAANKSRPHHVYDRDARPKDRTEEDYDVSRSPFGEHQRSVQPDDQHEHPNDVLDPSRGPPPDDVVRQV